MMKKSPSHEELMEVYKKYHTRKEETRFDKWGERLPVGIIKGEFAFCVKCGDETNFWSTQSTIPTPICSSTCNDEWWYDYFKEEDKAEENTIDVEP
jgi:hypothetical protein